MSSKRTARSAARSRRAWLFGLVLGLHGCAGVRRVEWSSAQRAQVETIERALKDGDLLEARAQFESLGASNAQRQLAYYLEQRIAAREIEPFDPAFAEISAALEARDDELARSILNYALARQPRGAALGIAQRFEQLLAGRARLGKLSLRLVATPHAEGARFAVELVAHNASDERLELRAPGAALDYLIVGLTPLGVEHRSAQRVFVDALDRLRAPAGGTVRARLGDFDAPLGGSIALRSLWRLSAASGTIRVDGIELPASELRVESGESVRLDGRLPRDPLEPAQLVDYLRRGAPSMASLLERAVRIAPERREEALAALTPVLLQRPLIEIGRAAPALRWLSGERVDDGFGEDGPRWKAWLENRAAPQRTPAQEPQLELPAALTGARAVESQANVLER